jgi:IS1 family transposase
VPLPPQGNIGANRLVARSAIHPAAVGSSPTSSTHLKRIPHPFSESKQFLAASQKGQLFFPKPNEFMANHLPTEKKVTVVSMLAEGSSMASIARITGIHPDTIMRLGVRVGNACAKILDQKMRGLNCSRLECDEIWGFVGAKRNRAAAAGCYGDVWTFLALDADTKLIPSFVVGKRDAYHAKAFMGDLAMRMAKRIQLSTDALKVYPDAIESAFGCEIDAGVIVKTYSVVNLNKEAASRYSPAEVVKTEKTVLVGMPDVSRISTSHIEKQNHTLRMHCRRLTRLTNAFSKKLENFEAAIALNLCYYDFCKRHITVRMTPAQAAGVETSQWTVAELVERCGEHTGLSSADSGCDSAVAPVRSKAPGDSAGE